MRRSRPLFAALVVLLACTAIGTDPTSDSSASVTLAADPTNPARSPDSDPAVRNAVVFLVDDLSDFACSAVEDFLPRSAHWLRDQGTCYENATTATPVCCPARAQVQTGQLPHNNRVRTQLDARLLDADDTVQHDLGAAGLRTYGVGKNLNGVQADDYYGPDAVDTGFEDFDFWNSYRQEPGRFQRYDDNGVEYTPTDGRYSTETNGALVDTALDDYLATGERFYIYDAFFAPHKQQVGGGIDSLPVPTPAHARDRVPPFHYATERDARDKLPLFRTSRRPRAYYESLWAARIRTMHDVDDQMAEALQRLESAGVLDETAVIFTSDNGYTDRGQVNWDGKAIPYPAATDIAMLAYYPGTRPAVVSKGVQLIDIAPTLYDVLDVRPGHQVDGHSLRGTHLRTDLYGEFHGERDELVDKESGRATGYVPTWRLLKHGQWSYVEWYRSDGRLLTRELYSDREMTRNLLWKGYRGRRPPARVVAMMHQRLMRFTRCAGTVEQAARQPCT